MAEYMWTIVAVRRDGTRRTVGYADTEAGAVDATPRARYTGTTYEVVSPVARYATRATSHAGDVVEICRRSSGLTYRGRLIAWTDAYVMIQSMARSRRAIDVPVTDIWRVVRVR